MDGSVNGPLLGLGPAQIRRLQAQIPRLHEWFRAEARPLPWRTTRDPYAIWVSEVMLQQTRVAAVVPYFERWLAALPTLEALATTDERRVLQLWEGLGYYSRVHNLHRAARAVVEQHGGRIPSDPEAFRSLPGVGPYTAAAVLSIAFDHDLAVVDGNVRRVLARLAALERDPRRGAVSREMETLAQALLPPGTAALHNQAVMELGAVLCTPRRPRCATCPLEAVCAGWASGSPERFPLRRAKPPVPHHDVAIAVVFRDDQVFIDRRPYGGLLGGLWEFPGGKLEAGESVEEALHRELDEEFGMRVQIVASLPSVAHAYSHFRVTLHPRLCRFSDMRPRVAEGRPWRWVPVEALPDHPMPRANRKVLESLAAWEAA